MGNTVDSLDQWARGKLDGLAAANRHRSLRILTRHDPPRVRTSDGRTLLSLSCNDVLGLSHHPLVVDAATAVLRAHGVGAGASRLVSGHSAPIAALETTLARAKGTADAMVFGSGYLASLGTIPALVGAGDLVVADALSHACLLAGATLSGATLLRFRHNDVDACARLLAQHRASHGRCLVVTETVFSMDGDRAPLPALAAHARRYDAWLLTDDAHGLGTLGDAGRGGVEAAGLDAADVPLQLGTLSKAAGSHGGYLCASAPVIDLLRSRARTFVYATALPPAQAAAADAALGVIARDRPLRERPLASARRFAARAGMPVPASHIVPVILGAEATALEAAARLERAGFLAVAIRPPTVAPGTARLRLAFPAGLADADIDRLADLVAPRRAPRAA